MFDEPSWSPRANPSRTAARIARDRSRITIQLTPAEKNAIDWLSRVPAVIELPRPFNALRGLPARSIAKQLSAPQLARLAALHTARTAAPDPSPLEIDE